MPRIGRNREKCGNEKLFWLPHTMYLSVPGGKKNHDYVVNLYSATTTTALCGSALYSEVSKM